MRFIKKSFFHESMRFWRLCLHITLLYGVTFLFAEFYDNPFSSLNDFLILLFQWSVIELAVFGLIYAISINRRIFSVVFPLITVLCTIIAYYRCTLRVTLTPDVIELALTNDLRTSMDVITLWLVLLVLFAFAVAFMIVKARFRIGCLPYPWLHFLSASVIILILLNVSQAYGAIVNRMPYSIFFATAECLNNRLTVNENRPDFKGEAVCGTDSITVVFVIGESLRAKSMQINGYERHTTPFLCKEKNAVSMSDIYSDYNITHLSIPHFMTRSDEKHPDRAYTERSFISLMRQAGYTSAWLANQESIKTFAYFMKECDRLEYVSGGKVSYIFDKWLDTDLLPDYDKELSRPEKRKLVVLHTVGSHWYYNTHFTPEFERFRPVTDSRILSSNTLEQMRNSYDNTILYSDYFGSVRKAC